MKMSGYMLQGFYNILGQKSLVCWPSVLACLGNRLERRLGACAKRGIRPEMSIQL